MKHIFTFCFFLFLVTAANAQGPFTVIRSMGSVARGMSDAKEQQKRNKQIEAYNELIRDADTLFSRREYSESIRWYNEALRVSNNEATYPREQIARARTLLQIDSVYNAAIERGDGHFSRKEYEEALTAYNQALEVKNEQYPKDRIQQILAIIEPEPAPAVVTE